MVRTETRGRVRLVTLDRPERRNALDLETCGQLHEAVTVDDDAIRVLVLTGAGDHFCSGADLSGVRDEAFVVALRSVLTTLTRSPVPSVAVVHGAALGAGLQLAIACDLRVAAPNARFGVPAAKLGLMVDPWTARRLATMAGHAPARAMLLAADVLTGEDAHRLGLVHRLGQLDDALGWADELGALAPLTVAGHKATLEAIETGEGHAEAAAAYERAWASADLAEGIAAFQERRAPEFRGR